MNVRKQGFTLVELLVYIVIAAIVVGIAGNAFLDATRLRVRSANLLKSSDNTTDAIQYLQEDIRRMGLKASLLTSSGASSSSAALVTLDSVYWSLGAASSASSDSSSFRGVAVVTSPDNNRQDTLEFKAGIYDANGRITGWQQIRYWVNSNGVLCRKVLVDSSHITSHDTVTVKMADSVAAFYIRYGVYSSDSVILANKSLASSCASGSYCLSTLTGYPLSAASGYPLATTYSSSSAAFSQYRLLDTTGSGSTKGFEVKKGYTYRFNFVMSSNDSAAKYFRSDSDYIAVVISKGTGSTDSLQGTNPAQFYSALGTDDATRSFEFTPDTSRTAGLYFRFRLRDSLYAATGAGFSLKSLSLTQIANDTLAWESTPPTDGLIKKRVKAIEINLSVNTKGTISTIKRVIPVPNNGA
ncbi:MAG TPA: prepilin-type N-terminal cleavage/methylation domain-containing protein [Fibrobacteraceae bacterium]|nr:prepilin-type N-terminal cleavage/methylation domain-containing protein [Fibrobacteraceae bacterium]